MSYQDRFKLAGFASFEALFQDPDFQVAFGEQRRADISPVMDFLVAEVGLEGKSVLDLGAGYGALSVPLAPECQRILACDSNGYALGAIRFISRRDGLSNLDVMQLNLFDDECLPLSDSSFDVVIVNGVLEYAGQSRKADPITTQKRVLGEIRRVLRPEGKLYWAIENRFSLTYFFSRGHDGLYYSSLLPRKLADIYSRWINKEPYQMAEPSYGSARRLLRSAGFGNLQFFCAVGRSYNHPHAIVSLDSPSQLRRDKAKFSKKFSGQLAVSLVTGLRLQRLLWPNFVILAQP